MSLARAGTAPRPPAWSEAVRLLRAGLAAADPAALLAERLALEPDGALRLGPPDDAERLDADSLGRIFLVAAGKAAGPMTLAAEEALGPRLAGGVAIVPRGAEVEAARTIVYGAGHPLPDPSGLMATRQALRMVEGAGPEDVVLVLLSGGASALLEQPAGRLALVELAAASSALLASGATIDEINAVRKHLSRVKGGGLARAAAPARVRSFLLSDVVGDRADTIGSGPTVPDPTTYAEAGTVLSRHGLWDKIGAAAGEHLRAGLAGALPETASPEEAEGWDARLWRIGGNETAALAAAEAARSAGWRTLLLGTRFTGEARQLGAFLAAIAAEIGADGRPLSAPACVVAGGETTVSLRRLGGRGGRNRELALAAAIALDGAPRSLLAALGTDGVDGEPSAAGAIVDGETCRRAAEAGVDAAAALDAHDSGPFFDALGDALVGGPTGTNVRDLYLILVGDPPGA